LLRCLQLGSQHLGYQSAQGGVRRVDDDDKIGTAVSMSTCVQALSHVYFNASSSSSSSSLHCQLNACTPCRHYIPTSASQASNQSTRLCHRKQQP
jgi:hypothetical protein